MDGMQLKLAIVMALLILYAILYSTFLNRIVVLLQVKRVAEQVDRLKANGSSRVVLAGFGQVLWVA